MSSFPLSEDATVAATSAAPAALESGTLHLDATDMSLKRQREADKPAGATAAAVRRVEPAQQNQVPAVVMGFAVADDDEDEEEAQEIDQYDGEDEGLSGVELAEVEVGEGEEGNEEAMGDDAKEGEGEDTQDDDSHSALVMRLAVAEVREREQMDRFRFVQRTAVVEGKLLQGFIDEQQEQHQLWKEQKEAGSQQQKPAYSSSGDVEGKNDARELTLDCVEAAERQNVQLSALLLEIGHVRDEATAQKVHRATLQDLDSLIAAVDTAAPSLEATRRALGNMCEAARISPALKIADANDGEPELRKTESHVLIQGSKQDTREGDEQQNESLFVDAIYTRMLKYANDSSRVANLLDRAVREITDAERRAAAQELLHAIKKVEEANVQSVERLEILAKGRAIVQSTLDRLLLPGQEWALMSSQAALADRETLLSSAAALAERRMLARSHLRAAQVQQLRDALALKLITNTTGAGATSSGAAPTSNSKQSTTDSASLATMLKEIESTEAQCKRLEYLRRSLAREVMLLRKDVLSRGMRPPSASVSASSSSAMGVCSASSPLLKSSLCDRAVAAALMRECSAKFTAVAAHCMAHAGSASTSSSNSCLSGSAEQAHLMAREGVATRQRALSAMLANNMAMWQKLQDAVITVDIASDTDKASALAQALLKRCGCSTGGEEERGSVPAINEEGEQGEDEQPMNLLQLQCCVLRAYRQRLEFMCEAASEYLVQIQREVVVPEAREKTEVALLVKLAYLADRHHLATALAEDFEEFGGEADADDLFSLVPPSPPTAFFAALEPCEAGLLSSFANGEEREGENDDEEEEGYHLLAIPSLPTSVDKGMSLFQSVSQQAHDSVRGEWAAVGDAYERTNAQVVCLANLPVAEAPEKLQEAHATREALLKQLQVARTTGQQVGAIRQQIAQTEAQLADLRAGRKARLTQQLEQQKARLAEMQASIEAQRVAHEAAVASAAAMKSAQEAQDALASATIKEERISTPMQPPDMLTVPLDHIGSGVATNSDPIMLQHVEPATTQMVGNEENAEPQGTESHATGVELAIDVKVEEASAENEQNGAAATQLPPHAQYWHGGEEPLAGGEGPAEGEEYAGKEQYEEAEEEGGEEQQQLLQGEEEIGMEACDTMSGEQEDEVSDAFVPSYIGEDAHQSAVESVAVKQEQQQQQEALPSTTADSPFQADNPFTSGFAYDDE